MIGKGYQFTGMDFGHLGQEVQIIVIQSGTNMHSIYPVKIYLLRTCSPGFFIMTQQRHLHV